jgi:uncharacterized protein
MEVVRWLVDQRATFGAAVCCATIGGHTHVVRLLMERGGDPTIGTTFGDIPLIRASITGNAETVRCLLDHPSAAATINHRGGGGRTALWWASMTGRVGVVRALLDNGADHTIADEGGRTPIAVAQEKQ